MGGAFGPHESLGRSPLLLGCGWPPSPISTLVIKSVAASTAIRTRFLALGHWIDRAFGVAMVALGMRALTADSR